MTGYGQFCPMAKATELIGEKWTLLILRELFLGTKRFNEFQRALSRMSPTLIAKRLKHLEKHGIIIRKKISGQKSYEYLLTIAGQELSPMIEILAVWGMRWVTNELSEDELDINFLMMDLQRKLVIDHIPGHKAIICLMFDDQIKHKSWWFIIDNDLVDLCTSDPGQDVDLYISSSVRTIVEVWRGDLSIHAAINKKSIKLTGIKHLIRTMPDWFGINPYKDIRPGNPTLMYQTQLSDNNGPNSS